VGIEPREALPDAGERLAKIGPDLRCENARSWVLLLWSASRNQSVVTI